MPDRYLCIKVNNTDTYYQTPVDLNLPIYIRFEYNQTNGGVQKWVKVNAFNEYDFTKLVNKNYNSIYNESTNILSFTAFTAENGRILFDTIFGKYNKLVIDDILIYHEQNLYTVNGDFGDIDTVEYPVTINITENTSPCFTYGDITKYLYITTNDDIPSTLKIPLCLKFTYNYQNNIIEWFSGDTDINDLVKPEEDPFGFFGYINDDIICNVYFTPNGNQALFNEIFGTYNTDEFRQIVIYAEKMIFQTAETGGSLDITQKIQDESCCFSEGTNILSLTAHLKEEYRLVQDLMIGDFIKTYLHGYRKVSRVISGSFVNNPNDEGVSNCMYRMKKTEDNGLIEDLNIKYLDNPIGNYLTLTRNHGVLVDKLSENEEKKVDKNNLPVIDNLLSIITADSDKFEKVMDKNVYKYYHFSLETDGDEDRRFGVYANGILVEVPSNNMMDNALNVKPLDF
jgi:hypothetical protein